MAMMISGQITTKKGFTIPIFFPINNTLCITYPNIYHCSSCISDIDLCRGLYKRGKELYEDLFRITKYFYFSKGYHYQY